MNLHLLFQPISHKSPRQGFGLCTDVDGLRARCRFGPGRGVREKPWPPRRKQCTLEKPVSYLQVVVLLVLSMNANRPFSLGRTQTGIAPSQPARSFISQGWFGAAADAILQALG